MEGSTLQVIGIIAETIAAVGVVISLVYLGVQIRQNTNAVRAATYEDVADNIREFNMFVSQNSDLAGIYLRGLADPDQLTPVERLQFDNYLGTMFAQFDTVVELFKRRIITRKIMDPYTKFVIFQLEKPGVATYWRMAKDFFSEDLHSYIEDRMGKTDQIT